MKHIFWLLMGMCLLTGTISCKKWLDARPDGNLFVDQVLADRTGFTKVLSGIYAQLGKAELYGRELEFGTLDAMVGYWQINSDHMYFPAYKFDYHNNTLQQTTANIWSGLYQAIHQCNLILAQVDNIKDDPYYPLLKGEALGLRAFLHFEILRLFGPIIKQEGLDTPAIPYYTSSTKTAQPIRTSGDCLKQIEADLQAAKQLLGNDPIIVQGREANGNTANTEYNALLDRRGIHMNYYAVMALLARKSQWAENLPEAASRAQQLLDELGRSRAVRFIESTDLPEDKRLTKENIWGLYINQYAEKTDGYVTGQFGQFQLLVLEYNHFLEDLYKTEPGRQDLRPMIWGIDSRSSILSKFYIPIGHGDETLYSEAQLINLPEIYFILTEAYLDRDLKKSMAYLNAIRQHRLLSPLIYNAAMDRQIVSEYLLDEIRREYIGEGFLFCYYKHLNHPIYRKSDIVPATEQVLVFPIPNDEKLINQPEN
ncbi:MAG: hypothetical protein K0R59_204 [Sphingobacterium sp.]|jgi:hypothetical protein|nr:hypothetical protein [Sphingobacterium sp.]